MPLKKIDDDVIKSARERQKALEDLCETFGSNIDKLIGKTNSPIILSMLSSLNILMEVMKDQIDFTRSGFDLFLEEIKTLNKKIEYYHETLDDDMK